MIPHTDTHGMVIASQNNREYSRISAYGRYIADDPSKEDLHSEALKITGSNGIKLTNTSATFGSEDCIDIVLSRGIEFFGHTFLRRDEGIGMTIKGSSEVTLHDYVTIIGKGRFPWDIMVGDYTIYEHEKKFPPTVLNLKCGFLKRPRIISINGIVNDPDNVADVWQFPNWLTFLKFTLDRKFGDTRKGEITEGRLNYDPWKPIWH